MCFAHSVKEKPVEEWHLLDKHLKETAKLSEAFAAEFGCGEWGYLSGLWHGNEITTKGVKYVSKC